MKYVPSALIGQLSRSAGSTTASRNRYGSYLRNRVVPTNPNTALQTLQRTILQDLSEQYRSLSEIQRSGWTALGLQIVRTDSLSQTYTLSGLQAYTSINRNRRASGLADVSIAPPLASPNPLTTISGDFIEEGTYTIAYTSTPVPAGSKLIIEATRPVSAGKNFLPRSEYKTLVVLNAAAASPATITGAYETKFGALSAGQKVFIRGVIVSDTGFKSAYLNAQVIVEA